VVGLFLFRVALFTLVSLVLQDAFEFATLHPEALALVLLEAVGHARRDLVLEFVLLDCGGLQHVLQVTDDLVLGLGLTLEQLQFIVSAELQVLLLLEDGPALLHDLHVDLVQVGQPLLVRLQAHADGQLV